MDLNLVSDVKWYDTSDVNREVLIMTAVNISLLCIIIPAKYFS
jgi:hypothetical protein